MSSKVNTSNATTVERNSLQWLPTIFQSLSYNGFLLLWLGQISRTLAMGIDQVARPVLVLAMTGSPVHLGLISIVRGSPMLLVAPIAGMIADRYDRRLVMVTSKIINILLHGIFALLILIGVLELWHVYMLAVFKSLIQAFDNPARQALLPNVVPSNLLLNALALNSGSNQLVKILSTSIAGFGIAIWSVMFGFGSEDVRGFGGVYLLAVITLIVSLIVTLLLKVPEGGKVEKSKDSWMQSLTEGFKFAWQSPVVLGVLTLLTVQSLFGVPYMQVFVPWLALEVMGIGPEGMGVLLGITGLGSLLGSTLTASMSKKITKRGLLVMIGLVLYGLALIVLGVTSLIPPVMIFGMFLPILPSITLMVIGLVNTSAMTIKNAVLFENIPNELRGRIMSLQTMNRQLSTVGSGMAGFIIALIGGPAGLALYGGICAFGTIAVGILFPSLRKVK